MATRTLDVLVVEDDLTTCDFMQQFLEEQDHQVTLCHNGLEAVELVVNQGRRFDIVVWSRTSCARRCTR